MRQLLAALAWPARVVIGIVAFVVVGSAVFGVAAVLYQVLLLDLPAEVARYSFTGSVIVAAVIGGIAIWLIVRVLVYPEGTSKRRRDHEEEQEKSKYLI